MIAVRLGKQMQWSGSVPPLIGSLIRMSFSSNNIFFITIIVIINIITNDL